jgi:hypothetical protein
VNGWDDRRNNTLAWRDKRDRDEYEAAHTENRLEGEASFCSPNRFFYLGVGRGAKNTRNTSRVLKFAHILNYWTLALPTLLSLSSLIHLAMA